MQPANSRPKFSLGRISITGKASEKLTTDDVGLALQRHYQADWGDLALPNRAENERYLRQRCRLVSAYRTAKGARFWVITEADRSITKVLLPEDF